MDYSTKIEIGKLKGKENWNTWKYKITVLLDGTEGALEAVEGTLQKPTQPAAGAGDAAVSTYNKAMKNYKKTESGALLMLTTNMTEETLVKVMRFKTAKEVWQELHRLFDGESEGKVYTLCLEFFGLKHNKDDDIPTHMSKLKNIWNEMCQEVLKVDATAKLPEILLICKALDTLDDRFFNFKSSWLMLKQTEKTIESLTSHLCTFERNLSSQGSSQQEALVTTEPRQDNQSKDKSVICKYCHRKGHRVRKCKKWIKDGKPPKPTADTSASASSRQVQHILIDSLLVTACSKGQTIDRESWFVDNGATSHLANRSDIFTEFHKFDSDHAVSTANGTIVPALGQGSVMVETDVNGKKNKFYLRNVWLVPTLTKNLFSTLATQDLLRDSVFTSTTKECKLEVAGTTRVIGKREPGGGLYKLAMKTVMPNKPRTLEVNAITGANLLQLYHERFAHQDKNHVVRVAKRELGIHLSPDKIKCEGCIYGKSHRKSFGTRERATSIGELIHTDVCGPFVDSISKYKYFVLFKDDYSGYRFVYFIKQKSEVNDKLLQFLQEAKNAGYIVKTVLSDNGGEFDNEKFRMILHKQGIQQRLTMPYTPEQNGCSERENRTLVEAARSMMHACGELPKKLWAELVNTAAYVLNQTGPSRIDGKTPFELWHGKKPKITHLRVIGSQCYAHIPKQCRKKLDKKAVKGTLIGYDYDDGYRIWNGSKTLRSRDITFESEVEFRISTNAPISEGETNGEQSQEPEHEMMDDEHALEGDGASEASQDHVHEELEEMNASRFDSLEDNDAGECLVDANEDQLEVIEPLPEMETRRQFRDRATLKRPQRYKDYVCHVTVDTFPETFKEAIEREDGAEWQKAMASEIKSLEDNKVWKLCDLPPGRKALPCKWVFRIKRKPDGTVEKYKARLVAKGFKQKKGIDYDQTFSPVARMTTIRALLSVSAKEKLHLKQFDVSTAFLNGKLKEEIYMKQPDGFQDGTAKVCKLQRSLYGLKQAPRCWNSCFEEILLGMGFIQSEADCCLFTREVNGKKILITLYVDDGLIAATDEQLANQFLKDLGDMLKITSKPASYYLGLEISRSTNGSIQISQESYTKKILQRFGLSDCNPVSTPIEMNNPTDQPGKVEDSKKFPYREAVGALTYLMTGTRPDIAYAVGVVSRKLENPTQADWLKVKRIFRYLRGTASLGIRYTTRGKAIIEGYSDADHGGDPQTGRSTTGVTCLFAGGTVSWLSQRQASVAISTTEAEIVAASEGARELVWLQRVFEQMTTMDGIPTLKVDNEAAIKLAHNPEFHKRTKHIRVRHFFVRETVQEGLVDVQKTSSEEQLADLMTKAVPKPRLNRMRANLGMLSLTDEGKC